MTTLTRILRFNLTQHWLNTMSHLIIAPYESYSIIHTWYLDICDKNSTYSGRFMAYFYVQEFDLPYKIFTEWGIWKECCSLLNQENSAMLAEKLHHFYINIVYVKCFLGYYPFRDVMQHLCGLLFLKLFLFYCIISTEEY